MVYNFKKFIPGLEVGNQGVGKACAAPEPYRRRHFLASFSLLVMPAVFGICGLADASLSRGLNLPFS